MSARPSARTVRILLTCAAVALAPALASAQIACNDTLGPGGAFALDGELRCVGTPLTLVGPVTVDLGGQRVQCLSRAHGIVLRGKGVKLSNGEVRNCVDGIRVEGEGRHRLEALIVISSRGDGVDVTSPSNRIEDVVVVDAEGDGFAIRADKQRIERAHAIRVGGRGFSGEGSGNRIEDSKVESSAAGGFALIGDGNRLERVTAAGVGSDGILVDGDKNRVEDSVVARCLDGHGLRAVGDSNQLLGNTVASGQDDLTSGLTVEGEDNRLQENRIHANAGRGIVVEGDDNQAKRNHVYGNGNDGFYVRGSENRVQGNTAFANGNANNNGNEDAVDTDSSCGSNRWEKNRFGNARPACIE